MKTISSLILLAAVAAIIVLPLSIEAAVSVLSVTGVAAMIITDYARRGRFARVAIAAVPVPVRHGASFRLAA
jgi:hypothetical protein